MEQTSTHSKQGQIFKNRTLESLTKTSATTTVIWYSLIILTLSVLSYNYSGLSSANSIYTYLGALLFWSLFEYIMHRYLFHWETEPKFMKRIAYLFHGIHHDYPKDEERLFMPPVPGLLLSAAIFGVSYLIFGQYSFIATAGLINGYLFYTYIHWSTHQPNPPRFLKRQTQHHILHHYRYPDKAFGVSSPLWDIIFRTMPPKNLDENKK